MKVQFISDIHLENLKTYPKIKNKDYENTILCLLGDIGYPSSDIYRDFMFYCSKQFKKVIVLFGNHEYWDHGNMDSIKISVNDLPIIFLDNSSVMIDGIRFIGSTLWSNSNKDTEMFINDYKYIVRDSEKIKHKDVIQMYNYSKDYILNEVKKGDKCILLTHFGVHLNCDTFSNNLTTAFVSDIPELYKNSNIIACLSGHTHCVIDTVIPNTDIKLLSNCMGHPEEDTGYSLDKILII